MSEPTVIPLTADDIRNDDGSLMRQQIAWWAEAAERAVNERIAHLGLPASLVGEPSEPRP